MRAAIIALMVVIITLQVAALYESRRAEQWSYLVLAPKDAELAKQLEAVGVNGYELVFARRASDGNPISPTMSYEMIFKRRGVSPLQDLAMTGSQRKSEPPADALARIAWQEAEYRASRTVPDLSTMTPDSIHRVSVKMGATISPSS